MKPRQPVESRCQIRRKRQMRSGNEAFARSCVRARVFYVSSDKGQKGEEHEILAAIVEMQFVNCKLCDKAVYSK